MIMYRMLAIDFFFERMWKDSLPFGTRFHCFNHSPMKCVTVFLCCLSAISFYGQTSFETRADTALARRLLAAGDSLRSAEKFDESMAAFQQALDIYEQCPPGSFLIEKAKANLVQGIIYSFRGYEKQSNTRLEAAAHWLQQLENPNHPMLASVFGQLGFNHCGSSRLDSGIYCHTEALRILLANYGDDFWRLIFPYMGLCECNIEKGNFEEVIDYAQKALHVIRNWDENNEVYGRCYMYIGRAYRGIKFQEDEAISWFEKTVDNSKKAGRPLQEADAWTQLGICYKDKKHFRQAVACCEKALELNIPIMGEYDINVANTYGLLGSLYLQLGDVDRAYYFLQKNLLLYDSLFPQVHPLVANTCWALGVYFWKKNELPSARKWLLKSHEMMEQFGETGTLKNANCLVALGNCARDAGEEKAAFDYYDEALHIIVPAYSGSPLVADCYLNIAKLFTRRKEFEKARNYLAEVLEKITATRGETYGAVAELWSALGDTYLQEGNYHQAMEYYNRVLATFSDDTNLVSVLVKAHQGRGICLQKQSDSTGNTEYLANAQQDFLTAFSLLEQLRSTFREEGSKRDLLAENISIVEDGLLVFQKHFEKTGEKKLLAHAFDLVEKSKVRTLREGLNENFALAISCIPDSVLDLENNLLADISTLQQRIFEAQNTPDSSFIPRWSASIFDKKQALQNLVRSLETGYPDYFRLKYNDALADASAVQHQLLDDNTALLEYFTGDSAIFIFTMTKDGLTLTQIPMPVDFETTIRLLRQSLTDNGLRFTGEDANQFIRANNNLYEWLLEKPLAGLPSQVKNLLIVPDGMLGYVPFEILGKTTAQVDFKNYPYLLLKFNISYAASANLLLEQFRQEEEPGPEELFAGFAPSYNDSDTLGLLASVRRRELVRDEKYDLPGAAREVQEIAVLLGGKPFLASDATEHNFKENAPRFRILHLAMHSLAEDRNPLFSKLLFTQNPKDSIEDNDLNTAELYNMHLPASLVVLSACNTGIGRLYRGEGILSLSRAFTYAGVPATVMSLWQAPDEATRQVMVSFYKNLKLGMRKDEALRQAKLAYLAGCKQAVTSPYYWAGFVASGEMKNLFGK